MDISTRPNIRNQTGIGFEVAAGGEIAVSGKLNVGISPYFNSFVLIRVKQ